MLQKRQEKFKARPRKHATKAYNYNGETALVRTTRGASLDPFCLWYDFSVRLTGQVPKPEPN